MTEGIKQTRAVYRPNNTKGEAVDNDSNKATPCVHTGPCEGASPPSDPRTGREGRRRSATRGFRTPAVRIDAQTNAALDVWKLQTGRTFADLVRRALIKERGQLSDLAKLALMARIETRLATICDALANYPEVIEPIEIGRQLLVIERAWRRYALRRGHDT